MDGAPRVAAEVDAQLALAPGRAPDAADVERALASVHAKLAENRSAAAALQKRVASGGALHDTQQRDARLETLLATLGRLEEHATRAEGSVGEITAEIRWLDMAKRNVGQSIVTLKRLQMLVSSTFHLEQLLSAEQYKEAASTLQAVQALLEFFAPYGDVEYIAQQRRQVQGLREQLKGMVLKEYETAFQQARARWDASESVLPDAALAVEALGHETRTTLIDWYCARQLREYRRVFRAVDEAGQLDNVARRYAWIRRVLRTFAEEHGAAFLKEWHVDQRLLSLFAEITRDDLRSVLVRQQPRLDADLLLAALNATNEFEGQVARQYAKPFADVVGAHRTAAASGALTITSAFAPYLGVFVESQEKRLNDMLAEFAQAPGTAREAGAGSFEAQVANHAEEPMKVLLSSTELFWFYRQTLERCAQLGDQAPFKDLGAMYQRGLRRYVAEVLQPALSVRSPELEAQVRGYALALNTADYCATTCTQLEQKLAEKLKTDAGDVSLEGEREAFFGVMAAALQHLSRALYTSTDAPFQQMLRPESPWAQHEHLGEKSAYVDGLASGMEQVGVIVRHEVENKRFLRSWCDKAATTILTRFIQTALRLRPMRQNVAAQLETDLGQIASLLRELPHFGAHGAWAGVPNTASIQSAYERHIDKGAARIAPLLAVLASTPDEAPPIPRLVQTYRTQVKDQSLANFQKVLDLKGIRRLDQNPFVEEFLAAIDREPEPLPTTSPLSSLPLDPNAEAYAPPDTPGERRPRDEAEEFALPSTGPATPTNARLPDWKRFGSMLGAALGREWRP